MPLSLAEIRQNAIRFSKEWKDASRERADAQTFWNEFFAVFGRSRKLVATFEEPVKNLKGQFEFIDLFWPGTLIAEHKSRGKDLDKANAQAINYIHNLASTNRAEAAPDYLVLSDFARIALHNLEDESASIEFPLEDLHKHIRRFAFIAGYQTRKLDPEDPANFDAVVKLANLHDQLEEAHFTGHPLERFLVRVLFCLFAEDTEIFEPEAFKLFLLNHTEHDGSDLGPKLAQLFQILDTPPNERDPNLSEDLAAFPHVNGELFRETLRFPAFTSRQREALLDCARFQWSKISPAIFGSLFQAAMQPKERRQIGAHYTSERDIMKLIRSLFLDGLRAEFESIKTEKKKLAVFHDKLASLKFLDPACGCGNFLVITYRELRLLELDALKGIHTEKEQRLLNIDELLRVNVDQMYGIEIEEWPARIAEVALWLLDHQMNQIASQTFGNHYARLPLKATPRIHVANALQINWRSVIDQRNCSYILGNPPFVGAKYQSEGQRKEMQALTQHIENGGLLDYVAGWYIKAAEFIRDTAIKVAFVSTNSITQGEQASTLWHGLFDRKVKILFAHRTFPWQSEARGKAHVHVVIIGFATHNGSGPKLLYDYASDADHPTLSKAENISPYLISGQDRAVTSRSKPLCDVPQIGIGNKPIDGGNYLFTQEEKEQFVRKEPAAREFFRPWIGSHEFINGYQRWCLWLGDCPHEKLRQMPECLMRVEAVRRFRTLSKSKPTQAIASLPTRFHVENMPKSRFLVIPKVSSEDRLYIPLGFVQPRTLASDLLFILPSPSFYYFGILTSNMHMVWLRQVGGRLKSDFRYSASLVYNNFPWPQNLTDNHREKIEQRAQTVLDVRKPFLEAGRSFADIYSSLLMPPAILKAHRELDLAVDRAYRPQPFPSDRHRFEFLFALYEQLISPLTATRKVAPKRKNH